MDNEEKSSAKTKKGRKIIFIFAVAALIAAALSFGTYAWLERQNKIDNEIIVSDFAVEGMVYFEKGEGADNKINFKELLKKPPYKTGQGEFMIGVNLTDSSAGNYIGNLRFAVKYKGTSPAYVRVRLLEQWSQDDVFIESSIPKYNVPASNEQIFIYGAEKNALVHTYSSYGDNSQTGTSWYDNRDKDFCFYYNAPVYPYEKNSEVYMLLLDGISDKNISDMGNARDGVTMQLMIQLQAVQPNRYREFFKLEKLPWEA